ncbi:MAG: hypothetical protein E7404_04610 [Ruminococcaceae bacterium]|nr:hypothetical protein [Oscillospiraceae bacterium]
MKTLNNLALMAKIKLEKAKSFLRNEEGDTNFISVLILLGIGIALAAVFIAFKDQVIGWVDENIGSFFDTAKGGR